MITSLHISLGMIIFATLDFSFEPKSAGIRGLLYMKGLIDQNCYVNDMTEGITSKFTFLMVLIKHFFKSNYYQLNNLNVSNCQTSDIDFSVPGKPSEKLIHAMSYSYDNASPTKYSTKSPLVTDLLIERELVSGRFSSTEGIARMDYFWLYVILILLGLYPCLYKITLSVYHSAVVYLFKDISTSNSKLNSTMGLQDFAPETRFHTPSLQYDDLLNNRVLVSSTESPFSSSTELSYFDLTNTAGHNLTAHEMLQVHYGPTGVPPAYSLSDIQSSQSGSAFSSFIDTSEDPSENVQNSVGDYDSTLDFDGLAGSFTDSSESSNQRNSNKKAADNSESSNKNNTTDKAASSGFSSSVFSDISAFSFISPNISLSSKFPEFANNQPNNNGTDPCSSQPSRPPPGAAHRSHSRNTNSESMFSSNGNSRTGSSNGIEFPKNDPKFANAVPTNIREELGHFSSIQPGINEFADRVKEKFERDRAKSAQRKDPSSGQISSSFQNSSHGSSRKSADTEVKFSDASSSKASGAPVSEVAPKYATFISVNFREKLGRLAFQKKAINISADQIDSSPVQTSDSPSSSHSPPYKASEDNHSNTSSSCKFDLTPKVSPTYAHAKPVVSREELYRFSAMKKAINDFADQTKAEGKKPMQKQAPSNVKKPKPTIQGDPQPSRPKIQTLDSSDTLLFAGLVPSKFKTQHQKFPSISQTDDPTSFLVEKQTNATVGSVESSDLLSSSSRTRPVYTPGTLSASQLLSSSSSKNSGPHYIPGSLRFSSSSSSSSKSNTPYSPGTLRPAFTETLPNNTVNYNAFQGIRGPFSVRTLADGIAECALASAQETVDNFTVDEATASVDSSASNSTGNSTIPLDAAQSFSNDLKPMESDDSNVSSKDQSFAVASYLGDENCSAQVSDEISNSNNGFESVDLLVTTTEPMNSVNLDSVLLDDQLSVPTAASCANNNSFETIDFATTVPNFTFNSGTVATFNLASKDTIDDSFEQIEPAAANITIANDWAHNEDLIAFSPNNHDYTYTDINYNIGPSNITITTTTAAAENQSEISTSNNIGEDVLKDEAKKEARYASKMAAIFPFTTTKEQYEIVSHGQLILPLNSGTPVYATTSNAITQSTSSDVNTSSTDKTGSPLLFVDTNKPPPPSESDNDEERPVSDLLVCQPAGLREYHIPKGLLKSLKKQQMIRNKMKGKN